MMVMTRFATMNRGDEMLLWDVKPVDTVRVLSHIGPNRSVAIEDRLRLSKQAMVIYKRLQKGPATNDDLIRKSGSRNFSARISDIRKAIKPLGQKIVSKRLKGGLFQYRIVDK